MLERFTAAARTMVLGARAEARRLGHDYIGTEHLVLSMTRSGAVGARLTELGAGPQPVDLAVRELLGLPRLDDDREALAGLGIDVDEVRSAIESEFGPGALERSSRRPDAIPRRRFTKRARKTLALAVHAAVESGQHEISEWHLFLGVLREADGLGCAALTHLGLDLAGLRVEVEQRLRPAA